MMKALVLSADYPTLDGGVKLMYVHTRNLFYQHSGIDVTVLNFRASECYQIEGIPVISLEDYRRDRGTYDVLICHAPNIRNHYLFLKQYQQHFAHILFFFHGHEILKLRENYPSPYSYMNSSSSVSGQLQNAYDLFKLSRWHSYFPQLAEKSEFIFVSQWLKERFFHYTKIVPSILEEHCHIIHNGIASVFETSRYEPTTEKHYDFITVRSNLDGSTYCIDIVNRLAATHPEYQFLVIGKGSFFQYSPQSENLCWMDCTLSHAEMPRWLNQASCALMPTRHDSQGLMTCEMASFGMPVITSDIAICHEILDGFSNVGFISNQNVNVDLGSVLSQLSRPAKPNDRYFSANTVMKEVALLKKIESASFKD